EVPQFRPLRPRVPRMPAAADREDALLGPAFLLVAPRPAKRGVKLVPVERLLQRLCFHHLGVQRGARVDRVDAAVEPLLIGVHDEVEPEPPRGRVAKRDHLAKFPCRIDVQHRKRRLRRMERLQREMQENARILADRIKQYWPRELGRRLAENPDRLVLQKAQIVRKWLMPHRDALGHAATISCLADTALLSTQSGAPHGDEPNPRARTWEEMLRG